MKRQVIVSVISLIVFVFLLSSGEGVAHQKAGMTGQGFSPMMGGGMMDHRKMGHSRGGLKTILHQWVRLLFSEKEQLGLTDEQLDEIQSLINAHMKTAIGEKAEQRIMDIELRELLFRDAVNFIEVEKRITSIANSKAEMDIDGVRTMEKVKNVLSEEQRKKIKSLFRPLVFPMMGRPSAPCMMGEGAGMMGPGKSGMMGSGKGGMMSQGGMTGQGGMMQGMMGGGMMQGQSEMGVSPSSLTKTDSQGPVTVEIIFDPQKQTDGDELLFGVKMNTHSAEVGDIDLGQLSVLRNEQGKEVNPSEWASPGGGGHHVEGMLVFPSIDPSGRPLLGPETRYLELVLRDVGGTGERVFRWDLKE